MSKVRKSLFVIAVLVFITAIGAFFALSSYRSVFAADAVNSSPNEAHIAAFGSTDDDAHAGESVLQYTGGDLTEDGTYYLTEDITVSKITVSANVTLCLNGHTISGSSAGSVLKVNSGATLNLHDCTGDGCITNGTAQFGGGVYVDGGTFNMYSGAISNNTATSYGGGVYVDGGTFNMYGGTISGNTATSKGGGVYVSGSFTMYGGTISGNGSNGVYVYNNSTFTMNGGTISGNGSNGVYMGGGTFTMNGGTIGDHSDNGVYVYSESSSYKIGCTMNGGTISNKTGRGVRLDGASNSFTMYGGTISYNKTNGVYINRGTFTMSVGENGSSGTIDHNGGSGVYVTNSGVFTMNDGTISNNTKVCSSYYTGGGGVYSSSSSFTMNGGTICNNTAKIDESKGQTVCGGGGVYAYGGTFTMNGGSISDNHMVVETDLDEAKQTGRECGGGGVYVGGAYCRFTMSGGTISDNTTTGNYYECGGGGVYVYSQGTFTMSVGEGGSTGTISGNTSTSNNFNSGGGGVYVFRGSTFKMYGGTISDNTATCEGGNWSGGGGVYLEGSTNGQSSMIMVGGTITGNTTDADGGGVYKESYASFTLGDKNVDPAKITISGNTATKESVTTDDNLYGSRLNGQSCYFSVQNKLAEGTLIGFHSRDAYTSGYGQNNTDAEDNVIDPLTYFFYDNHVKCVQLVNKEMRELAYTAIHHERVEACTSDGNIEYWECPACHKNYSDAACLSSTEISNDVIVIPNEGGHVKKTITAVAATCTTDGNIGYVECTRCHKYFEDDAMSTEIKDKSSVIIAKLDHKDADGNSTLVLDKTLNGYVAATCENSGTDAFKCSLCGNTYTAQSAALKHDRVTVAAKAASCVEDGNTRYFYCKREGCEKAGRMFSNTSLTIDITDSYIISATGHTYGAPSWEWSSVEDPQTHAITYTATATFTCSNNKCTEDTDGHILVLTEATDVKVNVTSIANPAATCQSGGIATYTATVTLKNTEYSTGDTNENKVVSVPAFAHNWTANWGDWSKDSAGNWSIKVTFVCNATAGAEHGETLTLTVGNGVTYTQETDPDCIHTGAGTYTASVVKDDTKYDAPSSNSVVVPATGLHSYATEFTVDVQATCTVSGLKSKHCTVDGCTAKDAVTLIDAIGHDWTVNVTDGTTKTYTALDKFNLSGLVVEFTCSHDESHNVTFIGGTSAATVEYASGDCLHYGDTSVTVHTNLTNYGAYSYTIDGVDVAKIQVTAGGANWMNNGAALMNGYVKLEDGEYKYNAASVEGATQVTNAVVRFATGISATVTYYTTAAQNELYEVAYDGVRTADASGMYTVTATLTLKDNVNYEFATPTAAGAELEQGAIVVTKVWYVAITDNGFVGGFAGWTFGATASALPALERDDGADDTVTMVLMLGETPIGEAFNRGNYSHYINSTMPAGSYTLAVTVRGVTVGGVEYAGFPTEFEFEVSKATFTVDKLGKLDATYDGSVHIDQAFEANETLITAGEGFWADYDASLYGDATITYSHASWNGTYYTATAIADIAGNTLFVNASDDAYVALYKVSAPNYVDVTNRFDVVIAKAVYNLTGVTFTASDDSVKYNEQLGQFGVAYDNAAHALELNGTLPAGVTVTYVVTANDNVVDNAINAGTYVVTANLTGDAVNYQAITPMQATLVVEKAKINLSLAFDDYTHVFDGIMHRIELVGELSDKVEVVYNDNSAINAGSYDATAAVSVKDAYAANYELVGTCNYAATLTITQATLNMDSVSFAGKTVTYTGKAYSLAITGTLPAGVTYSYEGNECVNAGTHEVKVHFYHSNPNYAAIKDMTAELNIKKADYDMSGVWFPNATVAYTGNAYSLSILGTVPAGVTYTYLNNTRTNAGSQVVTVKFTGDSSNYNAIPDMTATLKITPASLGLNNVSLEGITVNYDGNTHKLAINGELPEGVEVKYYITDGDQEIEFNGAMAAGTYNVIARFVVSDSENYKAAHPLAAKLTIVAPEQGVENPPVVVEPTVEEIAASTGGESNFNRPANNVMGEPVQKEKGLDHWTIAIIVIAAEAAAIAVIGGCIAFGSYKKKKR